MKIAVLLRTIFRFNALPNKIPMPFFTETVKTVSSFIWKFEVLG